MLTKEEIGEHLSGIHEEFQKLYKAKNLDAIVNNYHPDAVIIHAGKGTKYGKEEIANTIKEYLESSGDYHVFPTKRDATSDGEYLFEQGHFEVKVSSGETMKACYETIYKKTNGKYLVYHDFLSGG
uniref:DUF4440 domain-containing protein n=1 Tax=Acrobeloides nanus TaxID=290746 RepID=A0A914DR03_9BILA